MKKLILLCGLISVLYVPLQASAVSVTNSNGVTTWYATVLCQNPLRVTPSHIMMWSSSLASAEDALARVRLQCTGPGGSYRDVPSNVMLNMGEVMCSSYKKRAGGTNADIITKVGYGITETAAKNQLN